MARTTETITSPGELVAAVPHLLGFAAEESSVLIFTGAGGEVRLTVRLDLGDDLVEVGAEAALADVVERSLAGLLSAGVTLDALALAIAIFTAEPHHPRACQAVRGLRSAAQRHGVATARPVVTDGDRWWFADQAARTDEGTPVADTERERFAALSDSAPLGSRDGIRQTLAVDADAARDVVARLEELPARVDAAQREQVIDNVVGVLTSDGEMSRDSCTYLVWALADVPVRDTVLWDLVVGGVDLGPVQGALESAVRACPRDQVAPLATVLGLVYMLRGKGAHTAVAAEVALEADPTYSMAQLLDEMANMPMSPATWAAGVRSLSREDCLTGTVRG